jgi:hypothetical protein
MTRARRTSAAVRPSHSTPVLRIRPPCSRWQILLWRIGHTLTTAPMDHRPAGLLPRRHLCFNPAVSDEDKQMRRVSTMNEMDKALRELEWDH